MLKEFKEFAMKGNLVDIAVAFVMGAAFNKVVTSFTGGIVSPLIGLIFNSDFKDQKWILQEGVADEAGKITGEVAVVNLSLKLMASQKAYSLVMVQHLVVNLIVMAMLLHKVLLKIR